MNALHDVLAEFTDVDTLTQEDFENILCEIHEKLDSMARTEGRKPVLFCDDTTYVPFRGPGHVRNEYDRAREPAKPRMPRLRAPDRVAALLEKGEGLPFKDI
jgi:hypothetical protein